MEVGYPLLAGCLCSRCHVAPCGSRGKDSRRAEMGDTRLPGQVREGKQGAKDELEASEKLVWLQWRERARANQRAPGLFAACRWTSW